MRQTSPEIARWILSCSLHEVDQDQVLGDLEETFFHLAGEYGRRRARSWYWSQVLRSLPSFTIRTICWSLIMLKSYLTLARRRFLKEGAHTAINVVGLATALALCIVGYLNWQFDAQFDAFHTEGDRIYRIISEKMAAGETEEWGISPLPLAGAIGRDVAGIERTTRWRESNGIVRRGDNVFSENLAYADPAFLDMFTFELEAGAKEALRAADQVILSDEMARKYFGPGDAMGGQITVDFQNGEDRVFTVGGVLGPVPLNSSFQIDFLLPFEHYLDVFDVEAEDWKSWSQVTFVQAAEGTSVADIEAQIQGYIGIQNLARPDWEVSRFIAQPLSAMAQQSRFIEGHTLMSDLPASAVIGPAMTAILVLVMACFNFINLSIVSAGGRMKEIGLRKVMGGRRRQMVGQLLGESVLQCLLALGLAMYLATILTPMYNSLWSYVHLEVDYTQNLPLVGFLGALTLVTALLAGLYPAWYASAFSPVRILRGTQRLGSANVVSRMLLGVQYSLTILCVAGSIIFVQNARHQETLDMGYERETLMVVPLNESLAFEPFAEAITRHPAVSRVAGTESHIGDSWYSSTYRYADEDYTASLFLIGEDYIETAGVRLVAGRGFSDDFPGDVSSSVLVNETLVREMGWAVPVGEVITMNDSLQYSVVGVVEDFHQSGVWREISPVVMRLAVPEDYAFAIVKTTPAQLAEVGAFLEAMWREMAPAAPYDGYPHNELLAEAVEVSTSIRKLFSFVGLLALLIAGTGLFALVSLNVARRTKEIGIRKVLGASLLNIGRILNTPFIILIGAASVFAAVGGYFLMDLLLGSIYAYHIDVGAAPFVVATALTLVVALLTVSGKIYRAGTQDPVHALRSE